MPFVGKKDSTEVLERFKKYLEENLKNPDYDFGSDEKISDLISEYQESVNFEEYVRNGYRPTPYRM
jgi:hypothetical protein